MDEDRHHAVETAAPPEAGAAGGEAVLPALEALARLLARQAARLAAAVPDPELPNHDRED
ncbi:hypothetical protein LNKW23_48530 [Paralimibaculum aggregatum]|uniref:Uncharacterized protein n=1 Tax=Paralimibaculum aggregatum TaxID=3036245 RepID=A0ABQ6LU72_9RHOB|nr:hypothetical protein [Limibaculum sp. NKW23]GMG85630.1 hypothetical protein LNKW23_48530 [Limibaculum sp. NKW23]